MARVKYCNIQHQAIRPFEFLEKSYFFFKLYLRFFQSELSEQVQQNLRCIFLYLWWVEILHCDCLLQLPRMLVRVIAAWDIASCCHENCMEKGWGADVRPKASTLCWEELRMDTVGRDWCMMVKFHEILLCITRNHCRDIAAQVALTHLPPDFECLMPSYNSLSIGSADGFVPDSQYWHLN